MGYLNLGEKIGRKSIPPPSPPKSSTSVMKSGVRFIILTISSAVYERTESIAGGSAGVVLDVASWAFGLDGMGKGVSADGGRG